MSFPSRDTDRLFELLADRAGGEPATLQEATELRRLLAKHPEVDEYAFEHAAAAIHLAFLGPPSEEMPQQVRRAIADRAGAHFGWRARDAGPESPSRGPSAP